MLKRLVLMAGILLIASQPAMAEPQAADQQPVDPARLEAARSTGAHIFPSGTYARIMERSLDASLSMVTDSIQPMTCESSL